MTDTSLRPRLAALFGDRFTDRDADEVCEVLAAWLADEETVERVAQAMRDDNPPEAWTHPQIVPMDHFARVGLAALAAAMAGEGGAS